MKTFGQLIKGFRLEKGLTLEVVAKRIKSHKGYVSGIENGKVNPPSARIVKRLAAIYDKDYVDLLTHAELEKVHPDVPPALLAEFAMNRAKDQAAAAAVAV